MYDRIFPTVMKAAGSSETSHYTGDMNKPQLWPGHTLERYTVSIKDGNSTSLRPVRFENTHHTVQTDL